MLLVSITKCYRMNDIKITNKNDTNSNLLNPNKEISRNIDNFIVETETVDTVPSTLLITSNTNTNTNSIVNDTNSITNNIPIPALNTNINNIPPMDVHSTNLQILKSDTSSNTNNDLIKDASSLINTEDMNYNNKSMKPNATNIASSIISVRINEDKRDSVANNSEPAFSSSLKLNHSDSLINNFSNNNFESNIINDPNHTNITLEKSNKIQHQNDQILHIPNNETLKINPSNLLSSTNVVDTDKSIHENIIDNNSNLVDNNPLPLTIQPKQIFSKNRKSSLLIDSNSVKGKTDHKNTINNTISKGNDQINDKRQNYHNRNDKKLENIKLSKKHSEIIHKDINLPEHNPLNNLSLNFNTPLNDNSITTEGNKRIAVVDKSTEDSEKDETNLITKRPVTKIIERPLITSMNSRDLLLTDKNKMKTNDGMKNPKELFKKNSDNDEGIDTYNNHSETNTASSDKQTAENTFDVEEHKSNINSKTNSNIRERVMNKVVSNANDIPKTNLGSSSKNYDLPTHDKKSMNNIQNNTINTPKSTESNEIRRKIKPDSAENNEKITSTIALQKKNDLVAPINEKEIEENAGSKSPNDLESSQKPNKTEFFAARLASAVGENEISDSEETFVYESAANSTKNLIYPTASNTILSSNNINLNDNASAQFDISNATGSISNLNNLATSGNNIMTANTNTINNKPHGVSSKMSAPLLNTNKKILGRLKNSRHTSTGGILAYSGTPNMSHHFQTAATGKNQVSSINATSNLNTTANPDNIVTSVSMDKSSNLNSNLALSHIDDLSSMRSINHRDRQNDIQSVHSFMVEQHHTRSPDKRLSSISLTRINNNNENINYHDNSKSNSHSSSSNNTNNNGNTNNFSMGSINRQSQMSNVPSSSNLRPNKNPESKRVLRTTVSKIFDTNGTQLRRYSGVPDNVNLEDYIEQADDGLLTDKATNLESFNSQKLPEYYNNNYHVNDGSMKYYNGNINSTNSTNLNGAPFYPSNSIKMNSFIYGDPKKHNTVSGSPGNVNNFNHGSIIREEDEEQEFPEYRIDKDRERLDDDDLHSTFYYNTRSDLEARPQISDYEDDEDDMLLDNGADNLYMQTPMKDNHSNIYPNMGKNNDYYQYMVLKDKKNNNNHNNNNIGGISNDFMNENTPLRPNAKKRISRNGISLSPHNFSTQKTHWIRFKNFVYFSFIVLSLLSTGFLFGFLLATNKELQDLRILLLDNIISSADELIFDMTTTAFNPGFFAIMISNVQLDVFAKSEVILGTEAMLLGSVDKLDAPLKFDGGFLNRHYSFSMTTLKILEPGDSQADKGNSLWRKLIKHDYQLVVKGTVKYKIPFFNNEKTIAVQKTTNVNEDYDIVQNDERRSVEDVKHESISIIASGLF